MGEFLFGCILSFFMLFMVADCNKDAPAKRLRADHCQLICAAQKAEYTHSVPSMCVCSNGQTYHGKSPEFYEVRK